MFFSQLNRWFHSLSEPHSESRRDLKIALLLAALALVFYTPGINWGMPEATNPSRTRPWAPDELGPIGPIVELRNTFSGSELGNPQYPLFHYIVLAAAYAPYLGFQFVTGGLAHPQGGYPFGFADAASSVRTLLLIARFVSVLMGAGVIITVYAIGKSLWDRATGFLSALFVLLMYPIFYYSKISNVDVPALFWTCLVLFLFVRVMKDGLPSGRAFWLGVFAALAVATKDQGYAILLVLAIALIPFHVRALRRQGRATIPDIGKPLLVGFLASVAVYAVASGLILRPEKFFGHVDFIRHGSGGGRFYFEYPATFVGYWGLLRECLVHLADSMSWPVLLAAVWGVLLCFNHRAEREKLVLLLPIPGLFFLAFFPVRYVELRYVMVWALVLSLFAAFAIMSAWRSTLRPLRALAALAVVSACVIGIARDADLTRSMYRDSRYDAATWLAQNLHDGERLEIFGSPLRLRVLPELKPGIVPVISTITRESSAGELQGDFVIIWGRDDLTDFWFCPRWAFEGLQSGSLGYDRVAAFKTPSLFDMHTRQLFINPQVYVYARRERARQLSPQSPPGT